MKKLFIITGLLAFIIGCAWTKQAVQDYNTGNTAPLVNGEVSPSAQGQVIQNTVSSLPVPFAAPIAMVVGFLGTLFFTWQRGVQIRKNGGAPVANAAQTSQTTNGILQDIANIFSGMFTTASTTAPSTTGSVFQRVWKVALATAASGVAIAASNTDVLTFLSAHPYLDAAFVSLSSGLAGLEKALSTVPVASAPVATTTATT